MSGLSESMYDTCMCALCALCTLGSQKREADPWELELWMVVSPRVGSGNQTQVGPLQSQQLLLTGCWAASSCSIASPLLHNVRTHMQAPILTIKFQDSEHGSRNAYWVNCLSPSLTTWVHSIPQDPQGRREPTLVSCPLTSTWAMAHVSAHIHINIQSN